MGVVSVTFLLPPSGHTNAHKCPQMPFKFSIARVYTGSMVQETVFLKWHGFFSATTESGKPLLKESSVPPASKAYSGRGGRRGNAAKLCFLVTRIPF